MLIVSVFELLGLKSLSKLIYLCYLYCMNVCIRTIVKVLSFALFDSYKLEWLFQCRLLVWLVYVLAPSVHDSRRSLLTMM